MAQNIVLPNKNYYLDPNLNVLDIIRKTNFEYSKLKSQNHWGNNNFQTKIFVLISKFHLTFGNIKYKIY